jgi:hypothetical protein
MSQVRTIAYGGNYKDWTVKVGDDRYVVQLVRIEADLLEIDQGIQFWVGYQVTGTAGEDHNIEGTRDGNTIILKKSDLNQNDVDIDADLVVILEGFVAP